MNQIVTALVITLRGLHAALVGCYGNAWVSTLTMDWLASEGVVFDQHYANSLERNGIQIPDSIPSIVLNNDSIKDLISNATSTLEELQSKEDWLLWLDSRALLPPWEVPDEHLDLFFGRDEPEESEDEEEDEEEEVVSDLIEGTEEE